TYLAGLYRIEESRDLKYPVFAVLTRTPTDDLREIHDRMPLILLESEIDKWISPDGEPNEVVAKAVTDVVIEKAS
ncbi:MAG: SOS response-associated peptidase family protein, partial [Acutalibacteraceae bacterium]|nr:SOS response-associated peptidase family protein [Acutalibacteraceae bacterium]